MNFHDIEIEFSGVDLGDVRLNKRLIVVADKLATAPDKSIPRANEKWKLTKATYRFCDNESVTREKILEPHFAATVGRVSKETKVLVIEDTTTLNLTHHPAMKGIGPIGSKKYSEQNDNGIKGAFVHSALAITPGTHRVLGLLDQEIIIRKGWLPPAAHEEGKRTKRDRESQKWGRAADRVMERVLPETKLIFVFDREGDIFETISDLKRHGAGFVIRASANRRINSAAPDPLYSLDTVRLESIKATKEITVPRKGPQKQRSAPRTKTQPKRTAKLSIRSGTYEIMPPSHLRAKKLGFKPLLINVVSVVEEQPPEGIKPIEWFLITSEPVETTEDVLEVVDHYTGRWKIEEWHKALKTGCRIESRQLETWDRMEPLLGIFSVIAWRILALRDAARNDENIPCEEVLPESHREIICKLDPSVKPSDSATIFLRAIAKLGGFLARKSDGHPGWMTLWAGYMRLLDMEVGYALCKAEQTCG